MVGTPRHEGKHLLGWRSTRLKFEPGLAKVAVEGSNPLVPLQTKHKDQSRLARVATRLFSFVHSRGAHLSCAHRTGDSSVSEYQLYEFVALDQRLTAKQMAELRKVSTLAAITPTSFRNEYLHGDFRGNPAKLMERYFDAHRYLAAWGNPQPALLRARPLQTSFSSSSTCSS
jgi:hypothetical protein